MRRRTQRRRGPLDIASFHTLPLPHNALHTIPSTSTTLPLVPIRLDQDLPPLIPVFILQHHRRRRRIRGLAFRGLVPVAVPDRMARCGGGEGRGVEMGGGGVDPVGGAGELRAVLIVGFWRGVVFGHRRRGRG